MKIDIDFTQEELKLLGHALNAYCQEFNRVHRSHTLWEMNKRLRRLRDMYRGWYEVEFGESEYGEDW